MDLISAVLDSWDRQSRIVTKVANLIDSTNANVKPSDDGWPLYEHLAHMHQVRQFHLAQLDQDRANALPDLFKNGWEDPIDDLDQIRAALDQSSVAVREVMKAALEANVQKVGGYDHPILFLQHIVWHEGWHVGLILLGLRLAGQEPSQEWQEGEIWSEWRIE